MVSMISMVSGMGRRWWLAWPCWPAAGHAYRKLISHGMIGHDRSMSSRSADLGVSGRRARRHRTETETQPALTHATNKSVRVEIGLARSALPPSLQPPTLLWLWPLHVMGSVYVFSCSRVVSPVVAYNC
jgi:hypothetical protein